MSQVVESELACRSRTRLVKRVTSHELVITSVSGGVTSVVTTREKYLSTPRALEGCFQRPRGGPMRHARWEGSYKACLEVPNHRLFHFK